MRKRITGLLMVVVAFATMIVPQAKVEAATKKKTIYVIDHYTVKTEVGDYVMKCSYTDNGLVKSIEGNGEDEYYTYNDKNLLIKKQGTGFWGDERTYRYTYSGTRVKKMKMTSPTTTATTKYKWNTKGTKCVVKTVVKENGRIDTCNSGKKTFNFREGMLLKSSATQMDFFNGVTTNRTYIYDENGYLKTVNASVGGQEYVEVENRLKVNKAGRLKKYKRALETTPGDHKIMTTFIFSYRKIKVPADTVDLIKLQQQWITARNGGMEYIPLTLEMLTANM